jgi:AcrR family transcriptional regulator
MVIRGRGSSSEKSRPRVEGEREAEILDAALELLLELGYDRLRMDAVAVRAKASKATLYRRWSDKPSLVVDALLRSKKSPNPVDVDTGSLRGDLLAVFCGRHGMTERDTSLTFAAILTALHTDEAFAELFQERFITPKLEITRNIYARARDRGELADSADPALLGPALPGILLHRSLILREPITQGLVEQVIDQIILGYISGTK